MNTSKSLTESVVNELYELQLHKSCCQKAYLCGLLYGCKSTGKGREMIASFYRYEDAEHAKRIIDAHFSSGYPCRIDKKSRGGHSAYELCFDSRAINSVFSAIDKSEDGKLFSWIGFRCAECKHQFYRGLFISSATLSKPKAGYHLEFSVINENRANALAELLENDVAKAGRVTRSTKIGLYYKSNTKIADLLYFIGATRASFELRNVSIERDIRNYENRATNCVTRNISRSVDATRRQIEAIEYLLTNEKLHLLGTDLEYTARLRLENDSASMSELAMLHEPPISKSGLNSRLSRILAASEEFKEKSDL